MCQSQEEREMDRKDAVHEMRLDKARRFGRDAGVCASSWTSGNNTTDEWYRKTLDGIRDGDPEVLDAFNLPSLSGEFAGDMTPQILAVSVGLHPDPDSLEDSDAVSELCQAWEDGASDTFWSELERECLVHVGTDTDTANGENTK